MTDPIKQSGQERIKRESNYLKGDIAREMADLSTQEVSDPTYELLKFHGSYFGYDRDTATERKKAGLDKVWEFMVRMKCPGGRLNAAQYVALDALAEKYANGTLRITTRETFQFHCVHKVGMKPLISDINRLLLSTLGGCGDITRNIMTCPAPIKDRLHDKLEADAFLLAKHCAPKTSAYYEVWMDGEVVHDYPFLPTPATGADPEPLYGTNYMPRKFKIGISTPEDNCIDVLTHDLAILSLFDGQEHKGYNFALGGGMGMKHNAPKTYPRVATPIMYVSPELFIPATEAVIKLQRDHGDRSDRQHARLKYLVQEKGIGWTKQTLEGYLGRSMDLRLTADQNIILCDIETKEKGHIEQMLRKHGIKLREDLSSAYLNTLACVALPTCGKALAEAERVKLPLIADIEKVMEKHGVLKDHIAIRIAGCPNGCSRPYGGDIGIVGRTPEHYSLYIGGDFEGTRLNEKVFDKVPFDKLPDALSPMFALWKAKRRANEGFGNFCQRHGVAAVKQAAVDALPGADWAK